MQRPMLSTKPSLPTLVGRCLVLLTLAFATSSSVWAQDALSRLISSPKGSAPAAAPTATEKAANGESAEKNSADNEGREKGGDKNDGAHAAQPVAAPSSVGSLNSMIVQAELKTVKLYGAGGIAGLESYQSGFFIDAEGHILTVWSTVLDVDSIIVITSDGRRLEATVVGIDPNLEIAILDTREPATDFFPITETRDAAVGERVLAFSNLYGIATGREMSSVQRGVVMAKTRLDGRRGSFTSVYQGPIYVVDAVTNNPGAAGGALTDFHGQLLGMLGKELRDARANVWLNYAIPIAELRTSVGKILSGQSITKTESARPPADRPHSLSALGIVLVPDVLPKTPAYIDLVQPGSIAAQAKLTTDDLILFVNSARITSQAALRQELNTVDRGDPLKLLIQRGTTLKEVELRSE